MRHSRITGSLGLLIASILMQWVAFGHAEAQPIREGRGFGYWAFDDSGRRPTAGILHGYREWGQSTYGISVPCLGGGTVAVVIGRPTLGDPLQPGDRIRVRSLSLPEMTLTVAEARVDAPRGNTYGRIAQREASALIERLRSFQGFGLVIIFDNGYSHIFETSFMQPAVEEVVARCNGD